MEAGIRPPTPDSRGQHGESDLREPRFQQVRVLSLDRVHTVRSSNEYTDGPVVPADRPGSKLVPLQHSPGRKRELEPHLLRSAHRGQHQQCETPSPPATPLHSGHRTLSEQRLMGNLVVAEVHPSSTKVKREELKLPEEAVIGHAHVCADCGRCRCAECVCPRALPSCWACERRCVCSAETLLEYATCVCCVKALFYHCSSDDEDACADRPFSCAPSRRGLRWATIAVATLFLPCLLCYPPAKGCLWLAKGCYRHLEGPGCRCGRSEGAQCKRIRQMQDEMEEKKGGVDISGRILEMVIKGNFGEPNVVFVYLHLRHHYCRQGSRQHWLASPHVKRKGGPIIRMNVSIFVFLSRWD